MNTIKLSLLCCLLLILSYSTTKAQQQSTAMSPSPVKSGTYTSRSLVLRSDFPSKSVLVSNISSNMAGDMSPVIGTASWPDSGRQLQCRSLLEFNYAFLPKTVIENPALIASAELILFPMQVIFSQDDAEKPSKFIVRRVLKNWEDSSTKWNNQPATDSSTQVLKTIKNKQKNKPVTVDVTQMVKDMLQFGNQGFMICQNNSQEKSVALGQLFASPKNSDENLRPMLVIRYAGTYNLPSTGQSLVSADDILREFDRTNPRFNSGSTTGTTGTSTTNPTPNQPKVPIKD